MGFLYVIRASLLFLGSASTGAYYARAELPYRIGKHAIIHAESAACQNDPGTAGTGFGVLFN